MYCINQSKSEDLQKKVNLENTIENAIDNLPFSQQSVLIFH